LQQSALGAGFSGDAGRFAMWTSTAHRLPPESALPFLEPPMTADEPSVLGTAPGNDALKAGDRVPDVRFRLRRGPEWIETSTAEIFGGRRVIVFSLPGAFTPTCSSQHLPRYEELAPEFARLGIAEIVCVAVNDPFVMEEWGRNEAVDKVRLLPDGNAAFTRGMGMLVDKSALNFGARSWRYSMAVRDGVIEKLFVEPDKPGDPFEVSDADTMLRWLDPSARRPDAVALFSREGCEFCARTKAALKAAGIAYTDVCLPPLQRARALRAIAGAQTVPQVFVNGALIGDSEATLRWLASRGQ
jgi:peroxiredoxin